MPSIGPDDVSSDTTPPDVRTKVLIAGDGYAYVAYTFRETASQRVGCYKDVHSEDTLHLRILRLDPAGNTSDISVADWTHISDRHQYPDDYRYDYGYESGSMPLEIGGLQFADLITNADNGVVLSWRGKVEQFCENFDRNSFVDCRPPEPITTAFHLSGVSAIDHLVSLANQYTPIQPVLQAEDGTYLGTVVTQVGPGSPSQLNLVYVTPAGDVRWTKAVTLAEPKYALADGTFTVELVDAGGWLLRTVNLNANGVEVGDVQDEGEVRSWIGESYYASVAETFQNRMSQGIGPEMAGTPIVQSVAMAPRANLAATWAALPNGNHSGNRTPVQQEWFPELPSCPMKPPNDPPCAKEAIKDALGKLRVKMLGECNGCSSYVFNKLGSNQQDFYKFLSRAPRLFDGTRSKAPASHLCGSGFLNWIFCDKGDETVSDYMLRKDADAVSQTPADSGEGPMIFFNPTAICRSEASTPAGILNQATLFHESLHGYYGRHDSDLQIALGIDTALPSIYITYYLEDNVLGGGGSACGN